MPDKSPLAPELFQFTTEELSLATPEVLEVLMQNGSVVPTSSPVTSSSDSNTAPVVANNSASTAAATTEAQATSNA